MYKIQPSCGAFRKAGTSIVLSERKIQALQSSSSLVWGIARWVLIVSSCLLNVCGVAETLGAERHFWFLWACVQGHASIIRRSHFAWEKTHSKSG